MRCGVKRALLITGVLCCIAAVLVWRTKTAKRPTLVVLPLSGFGDGNLCVDYKGTECFDITFAPESDGRALQTLEDLNDDIAACTPFEKRLWVVGYFNGRKSPPRDKGDILIWDSIRSLSIKRETILHEPAHPYFVLEAWYLEAPNDYGVTDESSIATPARMIHRTDLRSSDFDPPLKAGVLIQRGDKYGVGDF